MENGNLLFRRSKSVTALRTKLNNPGPFQAPHFCGQGSNNGDLREILEKTNSIMDTLSQQICATNKRVADLEVDRAVVHEKVERLETQMAEVRANVFPPIPVAAAQKLPEPSISVRGNQNLTYHMDMADINGPEDNLPPPSGAVTDQVTRSCEKRRQTYTFEHKLHVIETIEKYMTVGRVSANEALQWVQNKHYNIRPCNIHNWWAERQGIKKYLNMYPEELNKTRKNKMKWINATSTD